MPPLRTLVPANATKNRWIIEILINHSFAIFKVSRPETSETETRPETFETETRPETFETETETRKNGSRDRHQVSTLHHSHGLWLGFSLQFTQCKQEANNSLPALKPWQNSFMHVEMSHCRCHGKLSRSCVPNLSCDHFDQSCSSKGKITRTLFCLMRQNRHYLTLSWTFKQHAYMLLQNLQLCGV